MRALPLLGLLAFVVAGCGGGGGGTTPPPQPTTRTISGRVLDVSSAGPPAPAATVTAGTTSAATDAGDGTFSLDDASGASQITVRTTAAGTWTFAVPAGTSAVDLGDLWIGPQRIRVRGTVREADSEEPVANARVLFAGRSATSNDSGVFTLNDVAYDPAFPAGFASIGGTVTATGYLANNFDGAGKTPASGVLTVDDVRLTRGDDGTPPPIPFTLTGRVLPVASGGAGATVSLRQGATVVRRTVADAQGRYYLWAEPGAYTLVATQGARTVSVAVTVAATNSLVRTDLTLP